MAGSRELLEAAIQEVEAAEDELLSLQRAANAFAKRAGVEPPYPNVDSTTSTRSTVQSMRPDQFVGFNAPAAAARAFLELRGAQRGAASLEDIFDALRRGGYSFEQKADADAKAALKVALAKDFNVHRIDNGAYGVSYGLLAWYPGVARDRREPQVEGPASKPPRRVRRSPEEDGQSESQVSSTGGAAGPIHEES
jgi:hypothetical protein